MATRVGAEAMHLGETTGSLEPGKRADLILVDLDRAHNTPRFGRDPNAIYAQLVYAAKASDVTDVMCNGRWLMRERRLLTLDEGDLRSASADLARRIDAFLIEREQSVLQKLVAIGGASEEESFEVQVKARLESEQAALDALASDEITVIRSVHYHQYDTYFFFDDPGQGRLRYREDASLDGENRETNVRARLTLTGLSHEAVFGAVPLFRSRFMAPATHSPRFYREYFKPQREREIEKDRRRWLVGYRGVQFYVHVDRLLKPPREGFYLEIKSRTWSRRDAQDKATIIGDLLERLGAKREAIVEEDYVDL
jgi:5-methylthioadenosine/S-adenosylhomocysteine deaminase